MEIFNCLETDFLWEENRGSSHIDACTFLNIACLRSHKDNSSCFNRVEKESSYALFGTACSVLVPD